ncbi:hypothetical protein QYE76_069236 [Lolium multiflorum]|uniref:Uncharacterized protein n=1 Tax=Lolium multiflorum TaxID=4521 RepID=A0AAD8SHC9_LOLMU|nr:hypothetical protein QYE76_069236 [Lolium multiflorum]
MRASKDNLSADAIDKRIWLLIKILRDLRIHVCNKDIHVNGSRIALEELEEKDLGTLIRIPHSGTNDPEAASDAEIPETSGPAKRKRTAPSGPAAKCTRETPSAAATRRAEKEKQRLKQIDTSKQLQPNIDQFFMTSFKTSRSKPSKNPKKKAKPSPAFVHVTPEVEVPPKASSSAKPDPKDVINLDDIPEEPTAESGNGGSVKGAFSSAPPPEQPAVTSADAPADEVERKLFLSPATGTPQTHPHLFPVLQKVPLSQRHTEISAMMDKVWGPANTEAQELSDLESSLKVFFADHKNVRQETKEKKECEEEDAQAIADLNEKLRKSNTRIKTLVSKAKTSEKEADDIDKLIFPTLGFEWNPETATRTEAYEYARNSITDLFEACRGIAESLSLKTAKTAVIDRMTKLMRMVPDLIKDWQASSARGVASLTLATCKAHCPGMDLAEVARGVPKGTNVGLALAETQGYDRLLAERVNHSLWYNKYDLPEGFYEGENEEDEDVEEGSGSCAEQSDDDSSGDSGDASAYVASEDEEHVSE